MAASIDTCNALARLHECWKGVNSRRHGRHLPLIVVSCAVMNSSAKSREQAVALAQGLARKPQPPRDLTGNLIFFIFLLRSQPSLTWTSKAYLILNCRRRGLNVFFSSYYITQPIPAIS